MEITSALKPALGRKIYQRYGTYFLDSSLFFSYFSLSPLPMSMTPNYWEDLLHGDETHIWGDSTYTGQKKRLYEQAPYAKDFTLKKGSRYRQTDGCGVIGKYPVKRGSRYKSKIRSRVEHVFGVMKCPFGFTRICYRGLDKNAQCVFTRCALVNLVLAKTRLLAL